jgi:hypothetical protein
MGSLSKRINEYIEKQQWKVTLEQGAVAAKPFDPSKRFSPESNKRSVREVERDIGTEAAKKRLHPSLHQYLHNNVKKQVRFSSEEEARKYGANIPPPTGGPKWEGGEQKKEHASFGTKPPKMDNIPHDTTKTRKPKTPSLFPKKRFAPTKATAVDEVAHQLTPKGPGYHSFEEVAGDVREANRLARKVTGQKPKIEA